MNELISEVELRELSRTLGTLIPKQEAYLDGDAFQDLEYKFRRVLHTAGSAKLSIAHGTAAWNCVHGFLDQGIASSVPQIRDLFLAPSIWVEVFDLFLATGSNNKPKPMKQVILTLAKVLSQNPDESTRKSLGSHVAATTILMIHQSGGSFSMKLVFQVLDHFIRKDIVSASYVVLQHAGESLHQQGESTLVAKAEISRRNNPIELIQVLEVSQVETLISNILDWARYPDISSIAGVLLVTLCRSLRNHPSLKAGTHCSAPRPPLWASPVKRALQREPSLLEIFRLCILPGLLRLHHSETKLFLDTLPLKELQQGKASDIPTVDIEISLLTLRECMESRLTTACGAPFLYSRQDYYNAQDIAKILIVHSSPSIRIAALNIAINPATSPAVSSSPFPIDTLEVLQQVLPHFQTETDAKVRNEYLVVLKTLFAHVRRGLVPLFRENISHEIHANENTIVNLETEKDITGHVRRNQLLLEKHVAFLKWFDEFLINELQPCASYQRHTTALKAILFIGLTSRFKNGAVKGFSNIRTDSEPHITAREYSLGFQLIRLLLDLIMDPFDDVRSAAASLLRNILSNIDSTNRFNHNIFMKLEYNSASDFSTPVRHTFKNIFVSTIDRAKAIMSCTGRADHADGFGRLCQLNFDCYKVINTPMVTSDRIPVMDDLLSSLLEDIRSLQDNFSFAAGNSSLHGNLIALRDIISSQNFNDAYFMKNSRCHIRQLTSIILDCCGDIWEVVKNVLCVDSPEGFEIDDIEDQDSGMGPKDTLSFAWRALKESSSLTSTLIISATCHSSSPLQDSRYDDFKRIGDLAFTQLAELRHRGAFSTVAQTFTACCLAAARENSQSGAEALNSSNESSLPTDLLEKWYRDTLIIIERNASALTRRSAGLPAIITGILGAHPHEQFFNKAILELQAVAASTRYISHASNDLRLPQVHALNCLKDVFTNTSLGTATEPHMAKTLDIAAGCLQVDVWAIRNCGLMLFRALLSRMHGGTDVASTRISSNHRRFSKLVYEKYPILPSLIRDLLSSGLKKPVYMNGCSRPQHFAHSLEAQRVLPALEIIERSGLPSIHNIEIQHAIRQHRQSPIWAIREKSAKALAAVVEDEDLMAEIRDLLEVGRSRQNALHGSLLCTRYMIARLALISIDGLTSLLPQLIIAYDDLVIKNTCPLTAAAYIDVIADVFELLTRNNRIIAQDFIMNFEGRLWTQGKDRSLYPSIDITFMNASGTLLGNAMERSLRLVSQMAFLVSSPTRDASIASEGPVFKVEPTSSFTRPDKEIPSHSLQGSMVCSSLMHKARFEVGSSVIAETSNILLNDGLPKNESALGLASDPNSPTAPRPEIRHVLFGPQKSDDDLRARGGAIASAFNNDIRRWTNRKAISRWICRVSLAADEGSELSTRQAAVDSVRGFLTILQSHGFQSWNTCTLIGVYIVLYDLLLDDDEDVRDKAAAVASIFLSTSTNGAAIPNISLMPPAASLSLLQYMKTEFNESEFLFAEAAYRLTGACSLFKRGPLEIATPGLNDHETNNSAEKTSDTERMPFDFIRPVREMVQEVRRQDNALFAEEKQNLFVDPVKEAENWALVLMNSIQLEKVVSIISAIENWTMEGLEVLVETANEKDGPLGWTTKPDVFIVGMRILLAAKVQIHWLRAGLNRETFLNNILGLLRTLLDIGTEKLLNGIWLRQIEGILLQETT